MANAALHIPNLLPWSVASSMRRIKNTLANGTILGAAHFFSLGFGAPASTVTMQLVYDSRLFWQWLARVKGKGEADKMAHQKVTPMPPAKAKPQPRGNV